MYVCRFDANNVDVCYHVSLYALPLAIVRITPWDSNILILKLLQKDIKFPADREAPLQSLNNNTTVEIRKQCPLPHPNYVHIIIHN